MKLVFALLLLTCALYSQPSEKLAPDCVLPFVFNAVGNSNNYDNRPNVSINDGVPCTEWVLQWSAQAAVVSLTIQIRGAGDAAGVPAAFSSIAAGTTFPSGKVTFTSTTGFYPWMQVRLNAIGATGNLVTGTLLGWKDNAGSIAAVSSAGCVGTQVTPCVTNQTQLGGSAVSACNAQALFNFSASGNAQLVAASGANRILICHYDVAFTSAVDFKLTYGTGANCAVGTTDLTGLKKTILTDAEDYGPFSPLVVPASQALCGNPSTNAAGGFTIVYAQIP